MKIFCITEYKLFIIYNVIVKSVAGSLRDQYVCKYTRVVPYYSTYKEVVPVYYIEPKKLNFFSTAYNYFFYSFNTTSYLLYRYSYKSYLYTNGLRSCISYYSSYKPNLYYTNTIVKSNNMYVSKEDTYNICNTYMFTYIFYKEKYLWNFISNFHKKGKKKKVLNVLFTVLQLVKQVTGLSVYKLLRSFSLDYKKKSFASITTTIKTKNFIKPYLYSYKKRFKLWILYFLKKTKSTYLDTVLSIAEIIAYQVVLYLHTTNLIEATYSEKEIEVIYKNRFKLLKVDKALKAVTKRLKRKPLVRHIPIAYKKHY